MEKINHPSAHRSGLFGVLDRNLRKIESRLGVSLSIRGDHILIDGPARKIEFAKLYFAKLKDMEDKGLALKEDDFQIALDLLEQGQPGALEDYEPSAALSLSRKSVTPKGYNQRNYIEAIKAKDLVFGIGPAGTGKTYLAMAMALSSLQAKQVERIILTRPAVEAGEKLGFLPGDMYQKINPYLRPLYDALFDLTHTDQANRLVERGVIEIAPLAYMRGRTLNSAFIIMDEAQNTTKEQMKMLLTRAGFGTRVVVTADITQIDLPDPRKSGVVHALRILQGIEEVGFIHFNDKDVVRHPLVQKIIKAYQKEEGRGPKA